jgi:hypothetical protein
MYSEEEPCLFCEGTGQVVSSTTISGFTTCDCINIPQGEPKHITVKEPCSLCDGTGETTFSGTYTTQRKCDLCNGEKYWNKKILVDQPKQERVEEAADNWVRQPIIGTKRESFIAGAKSDAARDYWFEQFKNK